MTRIAGQRHHPEFAFREQLTQDLLADELPGPGRFAQRQHDFTPGRRLERGAEATQHLAGMVVTLVESRPVQRLNREITSSQAFGQASAFVLSDRRDQQADLRGSQVQRQHHVAKRVG